jgi:hypothetical protein
MPQYSLFSLVLGSEIGYWVIFGRNDEKGTRLDEDK